MALQEGSCVQAVECWTVNRFNLLEIARRKMFLLCDSLSVSSYMGEVFCSLFAGSRLELQFLRLQTLDLGPDTACSLEGELEQSEL
jgi:hypothetical protein